MKQHKDSVGSQNEMRKSTRTKSRVMKKTRTLAKSVGCRKGWIRQTGAGAGCFPS